MNKTLNIIKRYLENYLTIRKFFKTKKECKVIFFSIPTEEFFAFQTYDVFETVNKKVHLYVNGTDFEKRKSLKLAWLTTLEKFDQPIQLIKSDEGYFCHPGTDRILIMTYLKPVKEITGIYLWYPDIDPDPIILNYPYKELTPLQLLFKFKPSETLKIKCVQMNDDLDTSDGDPKTSNASFATAKAYFKKATTNFDKLFLSWHDTMQWDEMKKINQNQLIVFNDDHCKFGSVKLKLVNNIWIKK